MTSFFHAPKRTRKRRKHKLKRKNLTIIYNNGQTAFSACPFHIYKKSIKKEMKAYKTIQTHTGTDGIPRPKRLRHRTRRRTLEIYVHNRKRLRDGRQRKRLPRIHRHSGKRGRTRRSGKGISYRRPPSRNRRNHNYGARLVEQKDISFRRRRRRGNYLCPAQRLNGKRVERFSPLFSFA